MGARSPAPGCPNTGEAARDGGGDSNSAVWLVAATRGAECEFANAGFGATGGVAVAETAAAADCPPPHDAAFHSDESAEENPEVGGYGPEAAIGR